MLMYSAFLLFLLCCWLCALSLALNNLTLTQSLADPDSIVSNNGDFKLGFFSPSNSTNRYVGIWYNKVSVADVFWVANRNNPVNDSTGVLKLSTDGNLQVVDGRNVVLWTSNNSVARANVSLFSVRLLDTGNLVVLAYDTESTSGTNETTVWQSFDHPLDSILPSGRMTLTHSNMKRALEAWKSPSDPSAGQFSLGTDSLTHSQVVVWNGDRRYWRSGPWNGNIFLGLQYTDETRNYANTFVHQNSDGTVDFAYSGASTLSFSHYALSYDGIMSEKWWDESKGEWGFVWKAIETVCDYYGYCGAFGTCNSLKTPVCQCLKGFVPKNMKQWKMGNWFTGCVRRVPVQCGIQGSKDDGFVKLNMVKVPDFTQWSEGLTQADCRSQCLKNCSCVAYAYDTGAGCMYWAQDLIDIQEFPSSGVDLYLRLPASELATNNRKKIVVIVTIIIGAIAVAAASYFMWRWLSRRKDNKTNELLKDLKYDSSGRQIQLDQLPLFDFKRLALATCDFHDCKKLGEGGFGSVFKGKLEDGKEIAVKRLAAASGQGATEFMNEVAVISKLQHRNLVKLLGCCVEKQEKMLIYEYMPNKSLDYFLFDPSKSGLLNWERRFNIIEGISRGLVYLHRDSRLRIIHRDLKASNVLLDEDLNPKISDFGMARIFSHKQDQDKTRRVVGTYGYMSPEYAMEGHFSEKSDVYSFGVLLLEIVTGKKSNSFWLEEQSLTLLGYVWKLWNDNDIASVIDPIISDPSFRPEVTRCIKVGLLCVQEFAGDRPSTSTVLSMVVNDIAHLPCPKQPGFVRRLVSSEAGSSESQGLIASGSMSITNLIGR